MASVSSSVRAAERPGAETAGEALVAARGVVVRYGSRTVVRGLDLDIRRGEVYALLGRNGSGKSSLVRTLLGLQPASAGSIAVLGGDPWRERARLMARVGVVPEEPQAPPEMTGAQLVAFVGRLRRRWDGAGARARLQRLGIPLDRAFGKLSKGQKKQVELALALAHAPELLVLDDPTLGLDPLARRSFFGELMAELADAGTTILLTTHDLAAVEGIADRVGILADGRLLVDEPLEALKARFRRLLVDADAVAGLEPLQPLVRADRSWGVEVVVARWEEDRAAGEAAAQPLSLEEIFAALHPEPQEERR